MNILKHITSTFKVLSVLILLNGCQGDFVFVDSLSFDESIWGHNQPVQWKVEIDDTINSHNISLFVRNDLDFPYSNIYFFTSIIYDDSVFLSDTSQYLIADKYGRWLGRGLGNIKDNYFLLEDGIVFPQKGQYIINVAHGMRTDFLQGIRELGIKIKKNS